MSDFLNDPKGWPQNFNTSVMRCQLSTQVFQWNSDQNQVPLSMQIFSCIYTTHKNISVSKYSAHYFSPSTFTMLLIPEFILPTTSSSRSSFSFCSILSLFWLSQNWNAQENFILPVAKLREEIPALRLLEIYESPSDLRPYIDYHSYLGLSRTPIICVKNFSSLFLLSFLPETRKMRVLKFFPFANSANLFNFFILQIFSITIIFLFLF